MKGQIVEIKINGIPIKAKGEITIKEDRLPRKLKKERKKPLKWRTKWGGSFKLY